RSSAFRGNLVAVTGLLVETDRFGGKAAEEETGMRVMNLLSSSIVVVGVSVLLSTWLTARPDARPAPPTLQSDPDDSGGVVTSKNGPEAGVWVIAQTSELGTRFAKVVVTDDRGRYVIPDLPPATYDLWVRGYGLVDSPKVKSARGQIVNLTA